MSMNCLTRLATTVVFAACASLAAVPVAMGDQAASLVKRSPFMPPNQPVAPKPQPPAARPTVAPSAYEFRGVFQINGEYRFLLRERTRPEGRWLEIGDSVDGVEAVSYDPRGQTLKIRNGGSTYDLALATYDSNAAPIPVSGQPVATTRQAGPVIRPITPPSPRVTPPRPLGINPAAPNRAPAVVPEWIKQQMASQGIAVPQDLEAQLANPPSAPPPTLPPGFQPTMSPQMRQQLDQQLGGINEGGVATAPGGLSSGGTAGGQTNTNTGGGPVFIPPDPGRPLVIPEQGLPPMPTVVTPPPRR